MLLSFSPNGSLNDGNYFYFYFTVKGPYGVAFAKLCGCRPNLFTPIVDLSMTQEFLTLSFSRLFCLFVLFCVKKNQNGSTCRPRATVVGLLFFSFSFFFLISAAPFWGPSPVRTPGGTPYLKWQVSCAYSESKVGAYQVKCVLSKIWSHSVNNPNKNQAISYQVQ